MLSAGIVRSDNALVVSFVKLFLFPNLLSCILFAWTCFFIATISTGPSSWGDPLPEDLALALKSALPIDDIKTKLQSRRGYKGYRIRLYEADTWIAEHYTFNDRATRKVWRTLRDEKRNFRMFKTPDLACDAIASHSASIEATGLPELDD